MAETYLPRKVLLVEDEPVTLEFAQKMLLQKGYEVFSCVNGKEAVAAWQKGLFPVVITDIYMPEMNGEELINYLNNTPENPIILVISGEKDVNFVLNILRKGVFDYLIKPLERDQFIYKVDKAFELANYRRLCRQLAEEREILHAQKIDWNTWKEILLHRDSEKREINLFHNLKASLSQSAGFGGLLSLIPLIPLQAKENGDVYEIPRDLIQLILKNSEVARMALDKIDEISNAITVEYKLIPFSLKKILDLFWEIKQKYQDILTIKNQTLLIGEIKKSLLEREIFLENRFFSLCIQELLLNACKFSEEKSEIKVLFDVGKNKFHISFISSPTVNKFKVKQIPSGYERYLFDPFFRLHMGIDERYNSLDFGLGLTMVERVLRRMNGSIVAKNIFDYSNLNQPKDVKINFDIEFPLK